MKRILLFFFFSVGICNSFAQTLDVISNGALISVYSDSIFIDGNFLHTKNDSIANFGNIYLTGNWSNDSTTGNVFTNGPNGWLHLTGANQTIGGSAITHFNNLELSGTGTKQLQNIDTEIEDTLALNDRIFDVDTNTITILANGDVNSSNGLNINTTSDLGGYVSSENNGGLERVIKSANNYFFPVGSYNGTNRYRPLELTFNSAPSDTIYKVRMANIDPSNDGLDTSLKDISFCQINGKFYHRIYHNASDNTDITVYYDNPNDGNFQAVAHWEGNPAEWTNTINNSTSANSVKTIGWNDFSTNPFALAKTAPPTPVITASDSTTFCSGGSVTLTASTPADSYLWSNGLTTQSIIVIASGNYSVTVTNVNGCSAVSSSPVQITVNPTPADSITSANAVINLCQNDSVQLLVSGTGNNYNWSTGAATQSIYVSSAGNYSVTVTNANGCSITDSVSVSLNSFPDTMITTSGTTTFCEGGFVTLDAGSGFVSYLWNTGEITQTIDVNSSGNYSVTATDANNCNNDSSQATITVTVNPQPNVSVSPDDTINLGGADTLAAVGASNYQWYTDINSSPVHIGAIFIVSPTEETNYIVIGTNANGCSDTAQVKISVDASCVHALPNIFSPNDDGANDEFKIYGRGFELYYLTIYDRWGNQILEIDDINTGWNGKVNNNGEQLNNGVYVYIIKGKCLKSGEDFEGHGNVTLTR